MRETSSLHVEDLSLVNGFAKVFLNFQIFSDFFLPRAEEVRMSSVRMSSVRMSSVSPPRPPLPRPEVYLNTASMESTPPPGGGGGGGRVGAGARGRGRGAGEGTRLPFARLTFARLTFARLTFAPPPRGAEKIQKKFGNS